MKKLCQWKSWVLHRVGRPAERKQMDNDDEHKDFSNELNDDQTGQLEKVLTENWMDGKRHKLISTFLRFACENHYDRQQIEVFLQDFNIAHPLPSGEILKEKELTDLFRRYFDQGYTKTVPGLDKSVRKRIFKILRPRDAKKPNVICITVSESDAITATITNGEQGVIKRYAEYTKENKKGEVEEKVSVIEILRFHGVIGPVVMIDNSAPGLKMRINGEDLVFDLHDVTTFFRSKYSLTTTKTQMLKEVLDSLILGEIGKGNFAQYASSPITVSGDIVKVNFEKRHDVRLILRALRDFCPGAAHPDAFICIFSFTLLASLHDELKRRSVKGIQTPLVIETGKTRGGKTTLGNLFIGKGYGLGQDAYFYPYNRVATRFSLMKHLGESNLPALFDDLPFSWIVTHKEDLKSYVQTGHFGDRGRGDQTLTEYRGRRSFIGTINDDIRVDDDLALSVRLLILRYTEYHRQRKDKKGFDTLFDALPEGFMFEIFRSIFEGQNVTAIVTEVEKFENVAEWINYGIVKINDLCRMNRIEEFPQFTESDDSPSQDTNAREIIEGFLQEWQRIEDGKVILTTGRDDALVEKWRYRSPIEGGFKVEQGTERIFLSFTGPAFKTLVARQNLKVPFSNASNFMNNIRSSESGVRIENEGRAKSIRFGGNVFWGYTLSIPIEKEGVS